MCVSTGLLRSMGIIFRTQKMAAGHAAAAFHNTPPISLSKIQVLGAVPGRVPGTGAASAHSRSFANWFSISGYADRPSKGVIQAPWPLFGWVRRARDLSGRQAQMTG